MEWALGRISRETMLVIRKIGPMDTTEGTHVDYVIEERKIPRKVQRWYLPKLFRWPEEVLTKRDLEAFDVQED